MNTAQQQSGGASASTAVTTLTAGAPIVTNNGKTVGMRYALGTGPIAEMKKALRANGMSSREASDKIAEVLKGAQGNIAWAQAQTAMELARSKGMFPTGFDLRNKSFCIRGSAVPTMKEPRISQETALAALGITAEEFAALQMAKK